MGKFVGAVLSIGAAIAVNVIPGAGQVISGAIFGGLSAVTGTVGFAAATALTVSQVAGLAITLGVTAAGIQSLGGILGLGPSSQKPEASERAVKQSMPERVSAYGWSRLYGAYILYETNDDGVAVDVYAVHDGQLTEITQYYLNDDRVTLVGDVVQPGEDGRYGDLSPPKVRLYSTDGSNPGTALPAIMAALPGIWTANHRGDGVVLLAQTCQPVKAEHFNEVYPMGAPTPSMAAKWQKCPDPRAADPLDESGWTWTENAIRHLLHYMIVREGPKPALNEDDPAYPAQLAALRAAYWAQKFAPVLEYWKTAADICDQDIPLKAGGTEKRWRSCVSHKHIDKHAAVKAAILKCCDGWLGTNSEGAYIVYAGQYYEPTVSIGPDEIIAYEWSGVGRDDDEAVNEIVCAYVSAAHDYNTVETDSWRDDDDIIERGEILSDRLDPQVPSHGQVRRLAKREMARINAIHRGTVTTNASGRIVRGERYINLQLIESGTTFYDGPVEITEVTRNMATGGVTFSWVSVDPNIDAWNPATEEGDPAPVGVRVAPQPLTAPTIATASAVLSSGGGFAQISVSVDAPDRSDLTWYLRWKVSTDSVWNEAEYSDIDANPSVLLVSGAVPADASVDVAVSYTVGDGRNSPWSATSVVDTTTANLAPSPNTNFTATGGSSSVSGGWSNSTSSNFGHSELWASTTNDFGTAAQIGSDYTGAAGVAETFNESRSAGTWYLWTVAYNAAGTAYAPVGPISVTVT